VQPKNILLFVTMIILCTGCNGFANESGSTATPDFFTATLPPTAIPQATHTPNPPAPVPSAPAEETNIPPVEGTTTTQINVRTGPSTASPSLGTIGIFAKVQISGRDASGSWYQIIYAESEAGKGWVRAEYVQADAPEEIPLVETVPESESRVSGLVVQKINVRNGPGTEYETLGVLNPNDVVFITGRNQSGAWLQIEFAGAPDGKGWVTAEFLQSGNIESLPLIGGAVEKTATPANATESPSFNTVWATQDGDSMQAPLVVTVFSPTSSRALQVNGDISAPDGDIEDWTQFTSHSGVVAIQTTCSNPTVRVELWNSGKPVAGFSNSCGDKSQVTVTPNSSYLVRLYQNEPGYTKYVLSVEDIR
jgi:uncharacterized protein YraI